MTHSLTLPYSGTWEVPDGVTFAWGARLIITQDGTTDLLWDRQGAVAEITPSAWTDLSNWIDGGALKRARAELSKRLSIGDLSTREHRDVVLVDDGTGTIRGNPRASAGYCYVVAYLVPRLVPGVDYDPAVCDNCGQDEHTPEQLAECIDSVLGPPRTEGVEHGDPITNNNTDTEGPSS